MGGFREGKGSILVKVHSPDAFGQHGFVKTCLAENLNCANQIFHNPFSYQEISIAIILKLKFIQVFLKSIMYQGRFCDNFALFQGSQPVDGGGKKYSRKLASSTCGE